MHSKELKVAVASDYYSYTPSALAKEIYFYPMQLGYFYYKPNYYIKRNNYDSFLIIHVIKGDCHGFAGGQPFFASKNQLILLDCYKPHEYGSLHEWEAAWMHFDGPLARTYYRLITQNNGNILSIDNTPTVYQTLTMLTNLFRDSKPVKESFLSEQIAGILTQMLNSQSRIFDSPLKNTAVERTISYINTHFEEPLSLELLAARASISPYYFTRIFTEETGFSPHQYLIATRINAAKFLLKSSETSIKEISFSCGFNSESGFCCTFKKREGLTPSQYRQNILLCGETL